MTKYFIDFFMWKMDPISGCNICLVFTFPPSDRTLQYKRCVHFWNNFSCIKSLIPGIILTCGCNRMIGNVWIKTYNILSRKIVLFTEQEFYNHLNFPIYCLEIQFPRKKSVMFFCCVSSFNNLQLLKTEILNKKKTYFFLISLSYRCL